MQSKICTKCGIEKPLIEFSKRRTKPCGPFYYYGFCTKCKHAYNVAYRHKVDEDNGKLFAGPDKDRVKRLNELRAKALKELPM